MKKLLNKRTYFVLGIIFSLFIWLQVGMESFAFTRTTGNVTGSSVKIRESAGTDSEVVASVKAGDVVDVTDAVTASDGKVWYKILVSANEYGYIRSDFVTLASGEQTPSTATPSTPTTVEPIQVTAIEPQNGHTNTNNVKVRQQASTSSSELDRLNADTVFSVTGTATGTDNKVWYQVTYVDNGSSITGFIRSDLVELIEPEPEEEPEQPVEEPQEDPEDVTDPSIPTPSVEYEAVYTTDAEGNYVWYLYDRTEGQRYKIEQLLKVDDTAQVQLDEMADANFGLKIGLIITICLLVMVIVAVVFYFLRIRDFDDEPEPVVYRKRTVPSSSQTDVRRPQGTASQGTRPQGARTQGTPVNRSQAQGTRTQSSQGTVRPQSSQSSATARPQNAQQGMAGRPQTTQSQARPQGNMTSRPANSPERQKTSWKAKNFLEDNDEFEFGFLDFDEDDE